MRNRLHILRSEVILSDAKSSYTLLESFAHMIQILGTCNNLRPLHHFQECREIWKMQFGTESGPAWPCLITLLNISSRTTMFMLKVKWTSVESILLDLVIICYHHPKQKAFRKLKHLSKRMGKRKVKDKVGKAVALWRPFKELHTDWSEVVRSRTAQGLKGWASQVNFSFIEVGPLTAFVRGLNLGQTSSK